jgi:hypothetical protein
MSFGFLAHMRVVPDHLIAGMVTYPLDEVLLATLVGVVCGADDWEGVEEVATGALDWFTPMASRRRRLCARCSACWTRRRCNAALPPGRLSPSEGILCCRSTIASTRSADHPASEAPSRKAERSGVTPKYTPFDFRDGNFLLNTLILLASRRGLEPLTPGLGSTFSRS